ncbi:MAG: hypothetical protein AAGF77_01630 [Bacteroidota bacterium]
MGRPIDITLATDPRYLKSKPGDRYVENVLLEDQLVASALEKLGLSVIRKAWDDPNFDWSSTRYVLFRAVWDYFERLERFKTWFHATANKTEFLNPKDLILWNLDKHYLKDLRSKGIHIPKTIFLEPGSSDTLMDAIGKAKKIGVNSDEFVLKPCIGGGARHTYRFHLTQWKKYQEILAGLLPQEGMMLQEFQKNILSKGEVSIMVIHGKVTHAILKKAKSGDFRVQDDWGGTVAVHQPSEEEVAFAEAAIKACPQPPIYARVDLFWDNEGAIALAELEIFEPELWFRFFPQASDTLALAIKNTYF